jgi:two-component system sensor histidine kinase MtrB
MAKTKKMGFGGFLGGVLGGGAKAVKKAISNSPVKKALAGGIGAAKPSMGVAGAFAKNAIKSPAKTLAGGVMAGKSRPLRDLGDGRPPKPKAGSPFAPGLGPRGATVGGGRPAPRPMPIRDIGTGSMPRPGGIPKPGGMGPRPPSQVSGKPVGLGRAMGKKAGGTVKKAVKK